MTKVSKSCVIGVKEMCERCQSCVESARELCEGVREQRQRCHRAVLKVSKSCVEGVRIV